MDQYDLAASGDHDGLWDWDLVSNRMHFSPRWAAMLGCDDGEVGTSPEEWLRRVHPDDQARVRGEVDAQVTGGAAGFDSRHRLRHRNGTYRWTVCRGAVVRDDRGVAVRLVGAHADVTADDLADPVTGLPTRDLLVDHVARSIDQARRNPDFLFAVVVIDLDRTVPDEVDRQPATDPLVTASARRLESCLRGSAATPFPGGDYFLARLPGAQFAVLIDGLARIDEARAAAERLLADLLAPLQLRGRQVFPRASVGIAVSATGYTQPDQVLRDADAALYRARALGGNRCEVFDTDLMQAAETQREIEADLAQAIEQSQLRLFYQPVVEAESGRIAGFEALARWDHPTRGLIPPREFIPAAERLGLIAAIERWTLEAACRQLRTWQESQSAARDVWVSVNVSAAGIEHSGIVERVGAALRETRLDPSCLVLELTESVVIENPAAVKTLLMQLRVMGVRISIDDFGTGHSSFAYLHQFPADFLKIDPSFTRDLELREDKVGIVGTVAELAGQLGMRVIAEGIEKVAGLELVRSRGCDYVQGFLFSRPVEPSAAEDLLKGGALKRGGGSACGDGQVPRDAVEDGTKQDRPRGAAHALAGLVILSLLALPWVTGRVAGGPAEAAPAQPPPPLPIAAPLTPLAPPPVASAPPVRSTSAEPAAPRASAANRARAGGTRARVDVELPVEHQHVFGGCRGLLRVTPSGVSFAAADTQDVFRFEPGRFESTLGADTLTIKNGRRTFRFKAVAGATGSLGLRAVADAISDIQPR